MYPKGMTTAIKNEMLYAVVGGLFGINRNLETNETLINRGWLKKLWMKSEQIIYMWISSDPQNTLNKTGSRTMWLNTHSQIIEAAKILY